MGQLLDILAELAEEVGFPVTDEECAQLRDAMLRENEGGE